MTVSPLSLIHISCIVEPPLKPSAENGDRQQNDQIGHDEHEHVSYTHLKDRRIIVPADSLGYVIVGSEQRHAVGFGNLG